MRCEYFSKGFYFREEGKENLLKRKALGEIDSDVLTKRMKYNTSASIEQPKKRKADTSNNSNKRKRAKKDFYNLGCITKNN